MKYCLLSQHLSVCNQSRSQTEDPQHQQLKQRAKEVCMYFMREREREREREMFLSNSANKMPYNGTNDGKNTTCLYSIPAQ